MPKPKFELTHSNAFFPCTKTIVESEAVEARLQELSPDLIVELFHEVMRGGLSARNETTTASAVTAAGLQQWLESVKTLRGQLSQNQWRIHNERNCPFISSVDGRISIVVMTGDSETGRQGLKDPINQAEKGRVIQGFVNSNSQLELFNQNALNFINSKQNETQVWIFLYHYDKKLKEVRYELSYPTGFDKKKNLQVGGTPDSRQHSK